MCQTCHKRTLLRQVNFWEVRNVVFVHGWDHASASITTKGVHSCDKHNLRHHAQVQYFHNSDGYCVIGDRSTTKVVLVLELISHGFQLVK